MGCGTAILMAKFPANTYYAGVTFNITARCLVRERSRTLAGIVQHSSGPTKLQRTNVPKSASTAGQPLLRT